MWLEIPCALASRPFGRGAIFKTFFFVWSSSDHCAIFTLTFRISVLKVSCAPIVLSYESDVAGASGRSRQEEERERESKNRRSKQGVIFG